jgi:hypothetical protein
MRGAISTLTQYAFMARCLVKAQGQLYLYLIRNRALLSASQIVRVLIIVYLRYLLDLYLFSNSVALQRIVVTINQSAYGRNNKMPIK